MDIGGADRTLPKSFKRLPFELHHRRNASRRFALWNLPATGAAIGILIVIIDIKFALDGPHLRNLNERLFAITWPLLLIFAAQLLLLAYIRRWVRREQARRAALRRERRLETKPDAQPATPPAT